MTEGEDRVHSPSAHTHRATDDQWAVLERLARAATPGEWLYSGSGKPEWVNVTWYIETNPPGDGNFIAEPQSEDDAAYIAAANPATVLKLIEAARASQVGMTSNARNAPNPPPKEAEPWRPIVFRSKSHLIDAVLGGLWDYPHKQGAPVDLVHLWAAGVEEDQSRAALPSPPDQKKG